MELLKYMKAHDWAAFVPCNYNYMLMTHHTVADYFLTFYAHESVWISTYDGRTRGEYRETNDVLKRVHDNR